MVVPCYNEEKLASVTIKRIPSFVDLILAVNDCSTDKTVDILKEAKKSTKNLDILDNDTNLGLGGSMLRAMEYLQSKDFDAVGVMAGDNQMDPEYLPVLLDELIDSSADMVKANRFLHHEELKSMPTYRRIGNIFISIITKFATGYYSIFDSQNGYVIYRASILKSIPKKLIGHRYEYENTMMVALSIVGAKIKDVAVPAVYGEETSTINLFGTSARTLHSLHKGFWQRIYYKYILMNFHPIALLLLVGLPMFWFGVIVSVVLVVARILSNSTPTSATVMLGVLPVILGIQLLLTALIMDVNNEVK